MSGIFLLNELNMCNNNNVRTVLNEKFGNNSVNEEYIQQAKFLIESIENYEEVFEASSSHLYALGVYENNDKYATSDVYAQLNSIDNMNDYLYESVKDVISNAKYKYKKKEQIVDRAVADKIRKMNDEIKNDIREKYVERVPFKLSKIVKMALAAGAAWAISPAIAAVGAVVTFARSKKVNDREKDRLISEIREERTIVEEKIKDADANADKKEKYELMRLKISLDRAEKRLLMD